jgi:hypothetical protein
MAGHLHAAGSIEQHRPAGQGTDLRLWRVGADAQQHADQHQQPCARRRRCRHVCAEQGGSHNRRQQQLGDRVALQFTL